MQAEDTEIPGVRLLTPAVHGDSRGFLSEVYNAQALRAAAGVDIAFVQDNHSYSRARGTLRGLHFQRPPFAQTKLVRVAHGRAFDVAVDLRADSPTFGRHVGVELSRSAWNQLLIPAGCAHGFVTLEPDTEIVYKVSSPYSKSHDDGIDHADPELAIDWPVDDGAIHLSDKDAALPSWRAFVADNPFRWGADP